MRGAITSLLILTGAGTLGAFQPEAWQGEFERATEQFKAGDPAAAAQTARDALRLAEAHLEPDELDLVQPLLSTSSFLMQAGEMNEAEVLAIRANEIAEASLASARERVATSLKFLGVLYSVNGNLDAAADAHRRAVRLAEIVYTPDHPETAKHLGNLGAAEMQRGDLAEARVHLTRSLDIWASHDAPHPTYAPGAMMNLGVVEMTEGNHEQAIALFEKAIAIQEAALGAADPRLANSRRRYAGVLRQLGREAEAKAVESLIETP